MSYIVKIKGDKMILEGKYIPEGYDCECKSCSYTVELPKSATSKEIKDIVSIIEKK